MERRWKVRGFKGRAEGMRMIRRRKERYERRERWWKSRGRRRNGE